MLYIAWQDGTKIDRYRLSEISSATDDFDAVLRSHGSFFHVSGIQPHPTNICFISHLLKNFHNSPFNEPDSSCYSILSPSMPREAISDLSELVILTFYARATIDTEPSKGIFNSFSQCCLVQKN